MHTLARKLDVQLQAKKQPSKKILVEAIVITKLKQLDPIDAKNYTWVWCYATAWCLSTHGTQPWLYPNQSVCPNQAWAAPGGWHDSCIVVANSKVNCMYMYYTARAKTRSTPTDPNLSVQASGSRTDTTPSLTDELHGVLSPEQRSSETSLRNNTFQIITLYN